MGENSHVGGGGWGVMVLSCDLGEQKVKGNVGIIKTLM